MRVTVIGAGAMGCLIGARLGQAGHQVHLVSRNREVRLAVAGRGVILIEDGRRKVLMVPIGEAPLPEAADLVVIMVKATDTRSAAQTARAAVGPDTAVLTLQNGLGNVEAIQAELPGCRLLAGTTTQGANSLGPGEVQAAGHGSSRLAPLAENDMTLAQQVADSLDGAGFSCRADRDPWPLLWNKLAVNAVINPLAALLDLTNGELLALSGVETLAQTVLAEVRSVARSQRVAVTTDWSAVRAVLEATRANRCSMLQDLAASRRTEIQALNGAVVRLGEAGRIATPVNATLTQMVRLAESRHRISANP